MPTENDEQLTTVHSREVDGPVKNGGWAKPVHSWGKEESDNGGPVTTAVDMV